MYAPGLLLSISSSTKGPYSFNSPNCETGRLRHVSESAFRIPCYLPLLSQVPTPVAPSPNPGISPPLNSPSPFLTCGLGFRPIF